MTGVFLQVRLASARLPRKALLELAGRTVVEHAMDSLSALDADVYAILTDRESCSTLREIARPLGFETFVGPRDDVLTRYAMAVRHFGVDLVVRATGDNPLVSAPLAEMIAAEHRRVGADYSGYDGPPLGTGVEILDATSVLVADEEAERHYDREHVSPFLYTHPDRFIIHRIDAPPAYCMPGSRVTLDTERDYELLKEIYADLYRGAPISVLDLVAWLREHLEHGECRNSA